MQSQSWSSWGRLRSLIPRDRWYVGATKCPRLLPGFLSAAPGLHLCVHFSYYFPYTPFPVCCVLGWTSALFLLWCCQREILDMHIWWWHIILTNTSLTFRCTWDKDQSSSMAQQVLHCPAPPCLPSSLVSHDLEPFVGNPTTLAFSTPPKTILPQSRELDTCCSLCLKFF